MSPDGFIDITSNLTVAVSGIMLNGIAQYPIIESVAVFAKLAAFKWDSDSTISSIFNPSPAVDGFIPLDPNDPMNPPSTFLDSSTDAFYGLGFSYKIADFDIRAEYEIYKSDGKSNNMASIGALYRF